MLPILCRTSRTAVSASSVQAGRLCVRRGHQLQGCGVVHGLRWLCTSYSLGLLFIVSNLHLIGTVRMAQGHVLGLPLACTPMLQPKPVFLVALGIVVGILLLVLDSH